VPKRTGLRAVRALAAVLVVAGLTSCGSGSGPETTVSAGNASVAAGPDDFYVPPSPLPAGNPGDVIRSRPSNVGTPSTKALANAWEVMYLSKDVAGVANAVTGTVLVPKTGTPAAMPIVGFGPGTSGAAFRCAPSKMINQGAFYEQPAVNDMLQRGYAVAVTDYEGYHPNPTTTYMTGPSMGHALLDAVRAAQRLPETGLSAGAKVVVRGYSQGGGAAMWAGQLHPTYAPEVNLVGVAAGGVPADLAAVGIPLLGHDGFGFFWLALMGLDHAYADVDMAPHLNDAGRAAVDELQNSDCVLEVITHFNGKNIGDFTSSSVLDSAMLTRVGEQKLGVTKIDVPVFQYHELQDGLVAFPQAETLRNTYCGLGVNLTWSTYDTQGASGLIRHINLVYRGNAPANAFIEARIAGTPATSNC
jgi:pimeloyl-ACP methyl ester carboxylesterase